MSAFSVKVIFLIPHDVNTVLIKKVNSAIIEKVFGIDIFACDVYVIKLLISGSR